MVAWQAPQSVAPLLPQEESVAAESVAFHQDGAWRPTAWGSATGPLAGVDSGEVVATDASAAAWRPTVWDDTDFVPEDDSSQDEGWLQDDGAALEHFAQVAWTPEAWKVDGNVSNLPKQLSADLCNASTAESEEGSKKRHAPKIPA